MLQTLCLQRKETLRICRVFTGEIHLQTQTIKGRFFESKSGNAEQASRSVHQCSAEEGKNCTRFGGKCCQELTESALRVPKNGHLHKRRPANTAGSCKSVGREAGTCKKAAAEEPPEFICSTYKCRKGQRNLSAARTRAGRATGVLLQPKTTAGRANEISQQQGEALKGPSEFS